MMEIQFIYNAKSNVVSSIFDMAHKIISPDTYQCNLCKITHSAFTETKKFKELKQKYNITLWHIDEYEKKFKSEPTYPVIIFRNDNGIELKRIETQIINKISSLDELAEKISEKVTTILR